MSEELQEDIEEKNEEGQDDFEESKPLVLALSILFILISLVLLYIIFSAFLVQAGVIDYALVPWAEI